MARQYSRRSWACLLKKGMRLYLHRLHLAAGAEAVLHYKTCDSALQGLQSSQSQRPAFFDCGKKADLNCKDRVCKKAYNSTKIPEKVRYASRQCLQYQACLRLGQNKFRWHGAPGGLFWSYLSSYQASGKALPYVLLQGNKLVPPSLSDVYSDLLITDSVFYLDWTVLLNQSICTTSLQCIACNGSFLFHLNIRGLETYSLVAFLVRGCTFDKLLCNSQLNLNNQSAYWNNHFSTVLFG